MAESAEQDPNLPLEADDFEDGDSAFGAGSDTTSAISSIFKYRVENGRTYHSYKSDSRSYYLPNDEIENQRLDFIHEIMLRQLDGKYHLCPAGEKKPLRRVLDAGTGTGIWATEFGDLHPDVQIVGVDLSPIQPVFTPPNVEFFVDDLEDEWTYHTPFDMIYCRLLIGAIKDWPKLFAQAFEHLNPGGYIEIFETRHPLVCDDGTLSEDSAVQKWSRLCLEASIKIGMPMNSSLYHKQRLIDAGFVNIVEKNFKWPMNSWPKDPKMKDLGAWGLEAIYEGLQALSLMHIVGVLGWSVEEVEVLLAQVRKDMRNTSIHAYWPLTCIYAQKPE